MSDMSSLVKYVAHHSILDCGLNLSPIRRNVLFCSWRYGFHVADVLPNNSRLMFHIYSCARNEVTDIEMNRVDLLFECVLIRDGLAVLLCWFYRAFLGIVILSVCPSVTRVLCDETKERTADILISLERVITKIF